MNQIQRLSPGWIRNNKSNLELAISYATGLLMDKLEPSYYYTFQTQMWSTGQIHMAY